MKTALIVTLAMAWAFSFMWAALRMQSFEVRLTIHEASGHWQEIAPARDRLDTQGIFGR